MLFSIRQLHVVVVFVIVVVVFGLWSFQGTKGFEAFIDHALDMSSYLADSIKQRDGFQLVLEVATAA